MKRYLYLSSSPSQLQQLAHANLKVITASSQAARALKVAHSSLESLAEQSLREKGLRVAPALQSSRLLRAAVSEVIQTLDIEGTTRALNSAMKAILRAGVDLNGLAAIGSFRTQQLARLAQTYTQLLAQEGIVDSTVVLWQAGNVGVERQQLFIYGYFNPRIDQLHFLNAIADDGSVMVLPCPESSIFTDNQAAVSWLQKQGWEVQVLAETSATLGEQLQNSFLQHTSLPPGIAAHIYPHMEAEVRGVLAQVKSLLSGGIPANEIVLVTRDDAFYGSTVLDVAQEYNLPVRAFYGIPLIATRLGAWVQLLLEVIQEKFPFESTAKLLSHPLCSSLSAIAWQEARKQHPTKLLDWQSLGVNLALLDWHYEDTRANWVEKMQDVLNKFNIRQGSGRWAREIVAYYKFQDTLVDLAKPEDEVISLEEFATDITGTLALLTVPAQPGRGGVELHTPLSLFGAKYQYVFVLGAVEGILPAPLQDDPMLDFYERKQLCSQGFNLEDAAIAARREAILFYTLLQIPTQSLIFSYPQMMSRTGTLPSPYLTQLGLEAVSPPSLTIASIEEARRVYLRRDNLLEDDVMSHAVNAWVVEKRREGAEAYDEYDGVINLPLDPSTRVFSASQLTTLGQCAFKWFAHKVLKIAELEEAEEELSALLRGNLYHRSLELALSGVTDLTQITANLEAAFLQAEKDSQLPVLSAWEARRSEHLQILNRVCNQPDFCQQGTQVLQLETEFSGEWYGLQVTGRIDRIDRTPEGLVLWDYKTSSQAPPGIKDEAGKANIDIQMPLYVDIAGTLFPGETVHDAYYYSVTKGERIRKKKPSAETLQAAAEKIKTYLQQGYYPVEPDVDQNACRYCAYDLVCRKGSRQSRKGGES
ncbi:MAG: PD-(D/E)XK nuclease family protein [Cyanomargarita calcarea GSE-NOS-MK-12-04C]|jgi:RecB family exonuclease|uniref:PD-(D/E)XK nuclease family protein n=1 Tax=Cyanomargarita calcarea GSE-NOS-MK-12-04C TaxID=2839659 RepID=A0A951UVW0_9CYAN|nr:PD-(D/E)XK nuclease family protein [Cyanomargarita calcarea GSE-NOS-MK-12-04C]